LGDMLARGSFNFNHAQKPKADLTPCCPFEAHGPHGPAMISVARVNAVDDTVTVDLNHPLAGKRLCFDVNVVEVREPSADELSELAADCGCGSHGEGSCEPGGGCGSGCGCC
jgi:FKBP-type peptidyl-prolyl cis-trans isomerase SlyD